MYLPDLHEEEPPGARLLFLFSAFGFRYYPSLFYSPPAPVCGEGGEMLNWEEDRNRLNGNRLGKRGRTKTEERTQDLRNLCDAIFIHVVE